MTPDQLQDLIVVADRAHLRERYLIAALVLCGCGDIAADYREGAVARLLRICPVFGQCRNLEDCAEKRNCTRQSSGSGKNKNE